jgi:tetratricopeptide (TPR) repeat protein
VKDSIGNLIKYGGIIALIIVASFFLTEFPASSTIDFSIIRDKLTATANKVRRPEETAIASATELPEIDKQRQDYLDSKRAKAYIERATSNYYQGSYEEALRRLERAKIHDPTNYSIFKLSGQIFFEKNKFRKAFNNWERATQLPNSDRTISRDIDVLKRLLRYSRNEIDKLQRTLNREPNNRLVRARLRELEDQMQD